MTHKSKSEQVDLIRLGYEALNRGDIAFVVASLSEAVQWSGYSHLPESGAVVGRQAVRDWLTRFLDAFESFQVEVVELIDRGEQVVALVKFQGRGTVSGVDVSGGTDAHVWTIRDGEVTTVTMRQGTREVLDAIGRS